MPTEGVKNWEKWKGEEEGELKPSVPVVFKLEIEFEFE